MDDDLKRRLLRIHNTSMLLYPVLGLVLLYSATAAGVRGKFFSSRGPMVISFADNPYSFSVFTVLFLAGAILMFVVAAQGAYHRLRLTQPERGLPFRLPPDLHRRMVLSATLATALPYLSALVFLR